VLHARLIIVCTTNFHACTVRNVVSAKGWQTAARYLALLSSSRMVVDAFAAACGIILRDALVAAPPQPHLVSVKPLQ